MPTRANNVSPNMTFPMSELKLEREQLGAEKPPMEAQSANASQQIDACQSKKG